MAPALGKDINVVVSDSNFELGTWQIGARKTAGLLAAVVLSRVELVTIVFNLRKTGSIRMWTSARLGDALWSFTTPKEFHRSKNGIKRQPY